MLVSDCNSLWASSTLPWEQNCSFSFLSFRFRHGRRHFTIFASRETSALLSSVKKNSIEANYWWPDSYLSSFPTPTEKSLANNEFYIKILFYFHVRRTNGSIRILSKIRGWATVSTFPDSTNAETSSKLVFSLTCACLSVQKSLSVDILRTSWPIRMKFSVYLVIGAASETSPSQ